MFVCLKPINAFPKAITDNMVLRSYPKKLKMKNWFNTKSYNKTFKEKKKTNKCKEFVDKLKWNKTFTIFMKKSFENLTCLFYMYSFLFPHPKILQVKIIFSLEAVVSSMLGNMVRGSEILI